MSLLLIVLGMAAGQILICLALALLFAVYPGVWISSTIRKRQLSIMKALPNVLDLLTLSVESGRDLLSALRDILARRKVDPLGEELLRTFQEIQLGRKRTDALRALTLRVRQADLTAAINAIIQAEELGVSIAQILHIQSDMQRNKRFMLAEKLANEASGQNHHSDHSSDSPGCVSGAGGAARAAGRRVFPIGFRYDFQS